MTDASRALAFAVLFVSAAVFSCSRRSGERAGAPAAAKADPSAEASKPAAAAPSGPHPALLDPSLARETAPEKFKVKLTTTKGDVTIEVARAWSPAGADRLYNLVKIGYFTDVAFFRVIQEPQPFVVQFGIHGDPQVNAAWRTAKIPDDPVLESNRRGYVSFATSGPQSRTTQLFINVGDNEVLDRMGFPPVGKVIQGMDVVDSFYAGYGEGAPRGRGPDQGRMQVQGNAYLKAEFPLLDYIRRAEIAE
ncbi:MAG: peptidylprolyl isomerase [Planctomycetota bacterium]